MMRINKIVFSLFIISAAIIVSSVLVAEATSKDDIVYPVAELGGCKNKTACFTYCENPTRLDACVAFAAEHNLLSPEELAKAQKFAAIKTGPGGCNSEKSCLDYCDNIANINECVDFGEKNEFLTGRELEEAKKVKAALDRGVKLPAGCTNEKSCKATCEQPPDAATARSCFAFARDSGLLPPEFDDEKAERMFQLIDRGEVDFGAMRKCEGLERGEVTDETTLNTCLEVGVKLGFMKEEEKEFAKKMMLEGGPDGCRGKACKDVCENNPEKCLQYFEEKGIALPAEAQEKIKGGLEQMKQALSQAPPEVLECLKIEIGADVLDSIQNSTISPSKMAGLGQKMGTIMQGCFAKGFGGGEFPGGFPGGPGGFPGAPGEFPGGPGEFPGGPPGGFPGGGMSPEVQKCLTQLGIRGAPKPEDQTRIRECVQDALGGGEGFDRMGPPDEFEFGPGEGGEGREGFVRPPENFQPPEGVSPEDFQRQFQQQSNEEIQRRIQEETQRRIQEQFQGGFPSGSYPPGYQPPPGSGGSQPPDPAAICAQRGGRWDGSTCQQSLRFNPPSLLGFFGEILGIR